MKSYTITSRLLVAALLALFLTACTSQPFYPYEYATIPGVPVIRISTLNAMPIVSKGGYRTATITIDGAGAFSDFSGPVQVRGRGNSTWYYGMKEGKKPLRLRLPVAAELLGLPAARNWVLLANYLDPTLMGNAIAFEAARLLDMPFTNHMIPVEVVVNGEYWGSYLFTEHKEVGPNRIDIGEDGLLLELDDNMDSDFEFRSLGGYRLPVMIAHPDLGELSEVEAAGEVDLIRADFAALERLVARPEGNTGSLARVLDPVSFAKYMVVYTLAANYELHHPKSVYMYRLAEGPYQMGPIWDFDWAYGYREETMLTFANPKSWVLPVESWGAGRFFRDVLRHPVFMDEFKVQWRAFYTEHFPALLEFVEVYGGLISSSYARDYERWHSVPEQHKRSPDFGSELERITWWLTERAAYIDSVMARAH